MDCLKVEAEEEEEEEEEEAVEAAAEVVEVVEAQNFPDNFAPCHHHRIGSQFDCQHRHSISPELRRHSRRRQSQL